MRGIGDVVIGHLPEVHSTLDAASLEVRGDGPTVNTEAVGVRGQRLAGPVPGDQLVHIGVG